MYKLAVRLYPILSSLPGATKAMLFLEDKLDGVGPVKETINGERVILGELSHFKEYYRGVNVIEGYERHRSIKDDDVIIDAGAYPGEFTVYAARKAKKVIALEPDHQNAEKLRNNIKYNGLDNVVVIERALWDSTEEKLFASRNDPKSTIDEEGDDSVSATTVDTLLEKLDIDKIDFIKIDIEGAEVEALKGADRAIKETEPFFAIATYHERDGEKTFQKIEDMLSEKGYNPQTGFSDHLTTWSGNRRK